MPKDLTVVFLLSLLLSLILTPIVRYIVLRFKILAIPVEDRWHSNTVALMGGISIFISFIVTVLLCTELGKDVIGGLLGAAGMFILGAVDDLWKLRPATKLAGQVIVAFSVVFFGAFADISSYSLLNMILTAFWITALTNGLNLVDNMDGLAGGITLIAALTIFVAASQNAESTRAKLSLALAGSCLGFLKYNSKPANIFMGDCGSLFLGYTLAILTLPNLQSNSNLLTTSLSSLLILSVVFFDMALVIILRLRNGKYPWQGGKDHASHRLVHILRGNEKKAVLILYSICILAGGLALIITKLSSPMAVFISLLWGIGMFYFGKSLANVK